MVLDAAPVSPDVLVKVTAADERIRVLVVRCTGVVDEAHRRHQTSPLASVALGRALAGGLLLSAALMKDRGRLTIRVVGKGPLGGILVDAGHDGSVRGYVAHPDLDLPLTEQGRLDVGHAVGRDGFLYVTHDSGEATYTGVVELVSGELGDDFTHYLAHSEQIPAALSLGTQIGGQGEVDLAGGLLVQLLPGAGDEIAWRLEQNIKGMPSFSQLARACEDPYEIALAALEGFNASLVSRQDVRFHCQCSEDRVHRALASLGQAELSSMIEEDGRAEVRCHFCNTHYQVSAQTLAALAAGLSEAGEDDAS
ncbi:MAG: Hsp33 family molecular chaperone HslO [Candidatus Sericytochromatia bacterium]|nr:Hsp33 family molecular chaperone HslO [Candidatus Sericytochromatia bacterium]